ncbi:cation transporter [Microvirga splendida]|uniref:Cation transporter n=1 Tax=Microvirga splendida TaxID=2795727 RepID=A0ABS0Y7I8_9HYPH|nr:cation transporter [Microvirga splendida]MBJ6128243.1 cation transporter [Microvirga splendida]
MKTLFRIALTASALMLAVGAIAAPQTVTLEVENVSCVSCAPIVKKALSRVPGVSQVTVIEADGMATATVTFDDEKVTPEALTQATTNAGFPSTVKGSS